MRILRAALAFLAVSAAACGERTSQPPPTPSPAASPWREVPSDALTPAQQRQAQASGAAREALASRLLARLKSELEGQGPASAIGVCRTEAPEISAEVARAQRVSIGRTSHRLRSPMNGVPGWAERYVAMRRETPLLLAHDDGRLATLHPIRLQQACLACHGPREALAPEVVSALARDYPADQATGFQEGDLRGWFWVEVPAP